MKKISLLILALLLALQSNLVAEDKAAEEKKLSYNIGLDLGSTYYWRGYDIYAHKLDAAETPSSVFNFAPGLYPTITVNTTSGFSFNIWGARSLVARTPTEGQLNAYDEVDLTATYAVKDKSGTFSSSLIGYMFPSANKSTPPLAGYGELVFTYIAPIILNPFVTFAASMGPAGGEYEYAAIGISHELAAGILKVTPKLLFGYWYLNNDSANNKAHIDLNVPFAFVVNETFEFHVLLSGCYRLLGFTDSTNKYSPFILTAGVGASVSF